MAFLQSLVLGVISVALSYLLRRRDRDQRRAFDNPNLPLTEEGTPVPLVWGRVRIRNPNVLWYGDLDTEPVVRNDQVVGTAHFIGLQLGLCLSSPTDNAVLYRIWSEDTPVREPMSGLAAGDAGATFTVSQSTLYGGRGQGGGLSFTARFYGGTRDQQRNPYLQDNVEGSVVIRPFPTIPDPTPDPIPFPSNQVPGYQGLSHVILERANIGESPSLRPLSFEVQILPRGLGTTVFLVGDADANPAEVLYDILNSDWGRLSLANDPLGNAIIDVTSFRAAAQTLSDETHGISIQVSTVQSAREVVNSILEQIDGVLYEEPTDRTLRLRLIRNDYTIGSLPVYDEDDIIEMVSFSRGLWSDTVNEVRIRYESREDDYKERVAYAADQAHVNNLRGQSRAAEISYLGVKTAELANALAARELALLSQPITTMRIRATRRAAALRPGDVIVVAWPDFGITQIVMRVQSFNLGTLADGSVDLDLIQDQFAVDYTIYRSPQEGLHTNPTLDASPVTTSRVIEMPRFYGLLGVQASRFNSAESPRLLYLALAPSTIDLRFEPEVSADLGTTFASDGSELPFTATAAVNTAYPIDTDEYDTTTGIVLKTVSDPTLLVATTQANIESSGANLILIGDELLAFETVTDNMDGTYTLGNVWRGVLDTSPRAHAADAEVWLLFSVQINVLGQSIYVNDEQDLQVRLLSNTGTRALDPTLANVLTDIDIQDRPSRAYPPVQLTVEGTAHPTEVTVTTVNLAWARRDRLTETIVRPDAADEVPTQITQYVARHRLDGGPWTEELVNANGNTGSITFAGGGAADLELYAQLTDGVASRSLFPVTRSFTVNASGVGNSLFYDTYSTLTPAAAWGTRQMISTYAGSLLRLRDSGGVEEDVGFDVNGDLNSPTGTAPFTVRTIYDQTGNGNHLEQTTVAAQPVFNATGSSGGQPAIEFNGTSHFMDSASFVGTTGNALELSDPIMLWAGSLDADTGYVAGMYFADPPEYGFAQIGADIRLYRDQFFAPNATFTNNAETAFISQVGASGFEMWQDTATNAIVSSTASTGSVTYSGAVQYRMRIMRSSNVSYVSGSFYEMSVHSGTIAESVRAIAFATPLGSYWTT